MREDLERVELVAGELDRLARPRARAVVVVQDGVLDAPAEHAEQRVQLAAVLVGGVGDAPGAVVLGDRLGAVGRGRRGVGVARRGRVPSASRWRSASAVGVGVAVGGGASASAVGVAAGSAGASSAGRDRRRLAEAPARLAHEHARPPPGRGRRAGRRRPA